MNKIKTIPYDKSICFKCLKKSNKITKIHFGDLGYGSGFDECSTMIQLCEDCLKEAPEAVKNPILENEDSEFGGNYVNEDDIFHYFDNLLPEGQQFVRNEFWKDMHHPIDPQDWLDYFINKDLPYEKAKEYGFYALEEINAYKERFPKCEYPVNRVFSDGSCGSYCPFGARGEKDLNIDHNISEECFTCRHYKERTTPLKTIEDDDWKNYCERVKELVFKDRELTEEIVIFTNYGMSLLPRYIRKEQYKNPENLSLRDRRGAVVDKLKEVAIKYDNMNLLSQEEFEELLSAGKVIYFKDLDTYFYHINRCIIQAMIVKVDTTKYWTIKEYDGAESIQYVDFNVIDPEIGYVKFK